MRSVISLVVLLAALAPVKAQTGGSMPPGPSPAASGTSYQAFTVPWGDKPGTLKQDIANPDAGREYNGPAAVRVGPDGDVYVVNTVGATVERFTPAGKFVRSYRYPAFTKHDAVTAGIDVGFGADGVLYVLELALRVLLEIGPDGQVKKTVKIPLEDGSQSILTGVEVDGQGRLLTFDGRDNRVIRFDREGKLLDRASHELVQTLSADRAGSLLAVQLASPDRSSKIRLLSVDPFAKKKQQLAELTLEAPACEVHVIGADRAGRIYLEVAFGAVENPTDRKVLVVSRGKTVGSLPIGEPSADIRMVRSRAVIPTGGFVTVRTTPTGLLLEPHLLPPAW